jgi:hypothetical protein
MEPNQNTPTPDETPTPVAATGQRPEAALSRRAVVMAVMLFILIVAGMFMFAFLQKPTPPADDGAQQTETPAAGPYATITRIDATHFYIDGVHTVVGEIAMPTPCDLLTAEARVAESFPEQITLDFQVINNADTCAQVVTPQRFMVSATASPEAAFSAVFMNRSVELNLVDAPPGETPEDFELFIKG